MTVQRVRSTQHASNLSTYLLEQVVTLRRAEKFLAKIKVKIKCNKYGELVSYIVAFSVTSMWTFVAIIYDALQKKQNKNRVKYLYIKFQFV